MCTCTYLPLGKFRFQALKNHFLACGLTARVHGKVKRLPANALSFQETKDIIKFLQSYAEDNAILLPGRIPGYKRDDLQLLPSSTTKKVKMTSHVHNSPCILMEGCVVSY